MVGIYDKEDGELKRDLVLRTADKAYVEFEFVSHPEFIKPGMKLLFREGKTKVWDTLFSNHCSADRCSRALES